MSHPNVAFDSKEESFFYSACLERYLFSSNSSPAVVIECGTGDGVPVLKALKTSNFGGIVYSYEINKSAYELAKMNILEFNLDRSYKLFNQSFFENHFSDSRDYLISDPPFLPSLSDEMIDPYLRGGESGNEFTMKLIELNFQNMVLMVASYTDPFGTLQCAYDCNYEIDDFMVSPMKLTFYSRDKSVYSQLIKLRESGKAFFVEDYFLLAGIKFRKGNGPVNKEKYEILNRILSSL